MKEINWDMDEGTCLRNNKSENQLKREYFSSGLTLGCTLAGVSMAASGNLWLLPNGVAKHSVSGGK